MQASWVRSLDTGDFDAHPLLVYILNRRGVLNGDGASASSIRFVDIAQHGPFASAHHSPNHTALAQQTCSRPLLALQCHLASIVQLLGIVHATPPTLLVWLDHCPVWRGARDVCLALTAVVIEHEGIDCLENDASELLVPGFEQVRVCLRAHVRPIVVDREGHGGRWWWWSDSTCHHTTFHRDRSTHTHRVGR